MSDRSGQHRSERPRTIRRLWIGFAAALAATLGAQILVPVDGPVGVAGSFGFYAWYGFGACVALVAVAQVLGFLLKRRDSYYDD